MSLVNVAKANITFIDSYRKNAVANTAQVNLCKVNISDVRSVFVSNESLNCVFGSYGDTIVYRAIVKDGNGFVLPATFVAFLLESSVILINNQAFSSQVYNQSTGLLTLTWIVPYPAKANFSHVNSSYCGFMSTWQPYVICLNWMGQVA
jgi:hypothetical protein